MNLVSIFSFKMPLQILYLSVGFKKHLSNKVLSRLRILNGGSAERCQLQGWLAPERASCGVCSRSGVSAALLQPSPAKHHRFPAGFLIPEWAAPSSTLLCSVCCQDTSPSSPSAPGSPSYPSPSQTLVPVKAGSLGIFARPSGTQYPKGDASPRKMSCFPSLRPSLSSSCALLSNEIGQRSPGRKVGVCLPNPLFRDGLGKRIPRWDHGFSLQQTLLRVPKWSSGVTLSRLSLPLRSRFGTGRGSDVGLAHPAAPRGASQGWWEPSGRPIGTAWCPWTDQRRAPGTKHASRSQTPLQEEEEAGGLLRPMRRDELPGSSCPPGCRTEHGGTGSVFYQ